jgi:transposase
MLGLAGSAAIFLYQKPIDLRKGFEGLSLVVEREFGQRVTTGAYFAFLNRKRDRMKVLYWDGDGLAIWYKRLEQGCFSKGVGKVELERREFFMLLEGVTPKRLQKRFRIV